MTTARDILAHLRDATFDSLMGLSVAFARLACFVGGLQWDALDDDEPGDAGGYPICGGSLHDAENKHGEQ